MITKMRSDGRVRFHIQHKELGEAVPGRDIENGTYCIEAQNGNGFDGNLFLRHLGKFIDLTNPRSEWMGGADAKFHPLKSSDAFSVIIERGW